MRAKIVVGVAAFVLGTVGASVAASAAAQKPIVIHPAAPSYSNTGPWSAPLSPGGISAGGTAFGGPGFNGPYGATYHPDPALKYSNTGPWSAPLSPGGVSAGGTAFGGPGFNGPYGAPAGSGLNAYASTAGQSTAVRAVSYSNSGPTGAPLSPGGISTGGASFGGPGYVGP